jgi:MFS family permease
LKKKELSSEKLRKRAIKKEKEIAKWEKEKARPKRSYYFAYLVFIITLIYATDEIASQIGKLMKSEIANDLFTSDSSVTLLNILGVLGVPFQALGLLYRPFADRWGRKTFLIINTFGMSIALLVIFLSNNVLLYFIGAVLIQFFIPHDMHVVYIMESSPAKHRARIYSTIKFFANMSVMLVPVLRRYLMSTAAEW